MERESLQNGLSALGDQYPLLIPEWNEKSR